MRARDRDAPPGAGAEHGVRRGLVGIGDALPDPPRTVAAAVAAAVTAHGSRAGRLVRRFAEVDDGAFIWTRDARGAFRLGRIAGSWRYDDSPGARETGVHHVRPALWLAELFDEQDVPAGVVATFARGGRNFQRIRDQDVERGTAALWERHA
jgi:hypothetical protein